MSDNQQKFKNMEEKVYTFAKDIFFKNQVVSNLLIVAEQKEILHLKMKEVKRLQEVMEIIQNFCEPQVRNILEVSQYPDELKKPDFNLVKNQVHQLVQNYENLEKIVKYIETINETKGKQLSKEWLETKQNLANMDINSIKNIGIEANNLR